MDQIMKYENEVKENIHSLGKDKELWQSTLGWIAHSNKHKYTYNFSWLGRPIIQYPQDMVQVQELVWNIKPDLIIEMGIAHGGSLILSASLLAMLDYCEAIEQKKVLDPTKSKRKVLGVDIDIREHNKAAIESHPLSHHIEMIQGSSTDQHIIAEVKSFAENYKKVLIFLDSNHTHEHVFAELEAYAPMTSVGSYCVVFDTLIDDLPDTMFADRPWRKGNSPKSAVHTYLNKLSQAKVKNPQGISFEIDYSIQNKLQITVAPDGYLKRLS